MYLLDTHTLIWTMSSSISLTESARTIIAEPTNTIFASVVNFWEISIKHQQNKLSLLTPIQTMANLCPFEIIDIDLQDGILAGSLDWEHRDPFDRMLVAQAMNRNYTIITRDKNILAHNIATLPA